MSASAKLSQITIVVSNLDASIRVPQRLGRVEILHPDRRAVTERIDCVVVVHRGVPEDGTPEADIDPRAVELWGPRYGLG